MLNMQKTIKLGGLFILMGLIFIAFFQGAKKSGTLFYDGIYQTSLQIKDGDTTRGYLRFYSDGSAIAATSTGKVLDLKNWFNKEEIGKSHLGKYTIAGKTIKFNIGLAPKDVEYSGTIKGKKLNLHIKSNINGFQGDNIYKFFKIKGMK